MPGGIDDDDEPLLTSIRTPCGGRGKHRQDSSAGSGSGSDSGSDEDFEREKPRRKKSKGGSESGYFRSTVEALKRNDPFRDNKVDFQGKSAMFALSDLEELCIAYASNTTTTHLDLKYCAIGDEGCKVVCKHVLRSGIKRKMLWLDLSHNGITDSGMKTLLVSLVTARHSGLR
jgi:hypothetical protein